MDNANSKEYLEKILTQVLENMKRTAHAPSVQMTDVPRDSLGMNDDDEAALDDLDDDENPDTRITQRKADKYVEKNGELSDSEDEDMDDLNGPNRKRRLQLNYRRIMDVGGNDSGVETGSGVGTPLQGSSLPDDADDMNVDELNDKIEQTPSPRDEDIDDSAAVSGFQSPNPPPGDDGDIEMGEADADDDVPANATEAQSTGDNSTITVAPPVQQRTPPASPPQPQTSEQPEPATTTASGPETSPVDPTTITIAATSTTEPEATGATAAEVAIKQEVAGDDEAARAQEEGRTEREAANAEGEARTEAAMEMEAKAEA